jgi:hypothetical protein
MANFFEFEIIIYCPHPEYSWGKIHIPRSKAMTNEHADRDAHSGAGRLLRLFPQKSPKETQMTLHQDWRRITLHAWSMRWWALAVILIMIEPISAVALDMSDGFPPIVRIPLAALSGVAGLIGMYARVIAQKNLQPPHKQYEDEQWDA